MALHTVVDKDVRVDVGLVNVGRKASHTNYIKTPQQHALFEDYQRKANKDLPVELQEEIKMPVKPVVTRWNSFEGTLQRAVELRTAIGLYINDHRRCAQTDDELAVQRGKQPSTNVPSWMRSDGLTTADWQVIVDYLQVLKPLKLASERLEGRGKSSRFGAIYEVIPCPCTQRSDSTNDRSDTCTGVTRMRL